MALEFLDAAYKAYHPDLRGATQAILRYLCKEIPQDQEAFFHKTRQAYVDRRLCVIMFYNQISSPKTVHKAIKTLTDLRILKAHKKDRVLKKGDSEVWRFYFNLDVLQRMRITYTMWEAAQVDLCPQVSMKEMIAEEQSQWDEESRQEEAMAGDEGEPLPVAYDGDVGEFSGRWSDDKDE